MATIQPINLYVLAALLFALLLKGSSISHNNNHHQLKTLDFTVYQHDFLNKTSYITVNGVPAGTSGFGQLTAPFGAIFALHDNLTETSSPSSKAVGHVEGVTITSSFDGIYNMAIYKFTLKLKDHQGSISILGALHAVNPSDIPVVGGTGDFTYVQGYVTTTMVVLKGFSYVYKIDFHLRWPTYAY